MPPAPLALLLAYKYWLLLPLAVVEGPAVALIAGFLVSMGVLELVPTLLILILGDIIPDLTLYWLGKTGHQTRLVKKLGNRLDAVEHFWHEHTFKSMLLSKWAFGLSPALLMSAGLARLPLRRYLPTALFIAASNYSVLCFLGYKFGDSYRMVNHSLEIAGVVVTLGIVFFVTGFILVSRIAKRALPPSPNDIA